MKPISMLKHAWNVFNVTDSMYRVPDGNSSMRNPNRIVYSGGNERSIITTIYNRIALDCAAIKINHVKLDEKDRYKEIINSKLNNCLTVESNIDQTGRALIMDTVSSMLDEGCIAIVPIDTDIEPKVGSYSIETMRVGKIVEWFPRDVKVNIYNDRTGLREDVIFSKNNTAIIENPFYAVMNAPNSTMQRLIHKLRLMDQADEDVSSGNLDLIIKLPYLVKTEAKRLQAEERRREIEKQLADNKYGVAYIDGTEEVTQLNRPIENNLMKQVEYLTNMLMSQLGMTQGILDGTADENTMNNYYSRVIEPILSAITDELCRKFLTKTARSQKQTIMYFRDPFKLIPVNSVAEMADKFTRNEIMSSNEFRQVIGLAPSTDPSADELRNKNLSQAKANVNNINQNNNSIKEEDEDNEK